MEGHIEIDLDFPVSLETVLTVNFNIEHFKLIFDFILQTLRTHAASLQNFNKDEGEFAEFEGNLKDIRDSVIELEEKQEIEQELTQNMQDELEKLRTLVESSENRLKTVDSRLDESETKINTLDESVANLDSKLDSTVNELSTELGDLKGRVEGLEEREIKLNERLDEHDQITASNTSNISNHEQRIKALESQLDSALKAILKLGGDIEEARKIEVPAPVAATPLKSYDSDLERIRKRIGALEHLPQDLQNQNNRLERLERDSELKEQKINSNSDEIKKLLALLKRLEKEMQDKVNIEDFDRIFQQVQAGGAAVNAPQISTKDLNLLRELARRLDEQDTRFQELSDKLASSIEDFNEKIEEIPLQEILDRLDYIERTLPTKADKTEIDELRSLISRLRGDLELIDRLSERNSEPQVVHEPSVDPSKLNAMNRRLVVVEEHLKTLYIPDTTDLKTMAEDINTLKIEFNNLSAKTDKIQQDLWEKSKDLQKQLKEKASLEDLKALEESLQAKILAICESMDKKFADKLNTKKSLKYLEKLIKDNFQAPTTRREGEDAMFARKPLGGWSCASCAKGLEKLMGKVGPYESWNKLPHRDPQDRMTRVGPGYSRMLATMEPELMTTRNEISNPLTRFYEEPSEPGYEESLPAINNDRPYTSYQLN